MQNFRASVKKVQHAKTWGQGALAEAIGTANDSDKKPLSYGRSPAEKLYLRNLSNEEVYAEFLTSLAIDTGFSEDALEGALEPLCMCCWQQARTVMKETEWSGDIGKLQARIQEQQEQLTKCNLTSMKAISNLQARRGGCNSATEADIVYHEPLAYLDPLTRELVSGIILEKVSTIADSLGEAMAGKSGGAMPTELVKLIGDTKEARENSVLLNDTHKRKCSKEETIPEETRSAAVGARRRSAVNMEMDRLQFEMERQTSSMATSMAGDSKGFDPRKRKDSVSVCDGFSRTSSAAQRSANNFHKQSKDKKARPDAEAQGDEGGETHATGSSTTPSGQKVSPGKMAAARGVGSADDEEIERLKEEIRKHEDDARRQKEAIKRLESALEESRQAAAKVSSKSGKLQSKGGPRGHKGSPGDSDDSEEEWPEEGTQQSGDQPKRHSKKKKPKKDGVNLPAEGPGETKSCEIQTDLTSEYLEQLFQASANLQATASNFGEKMAEAAAEAKKKSFKLNIVNVQTEASLRAMQLAHNVFIRLWDDSLLRGQGIRRRERAPAGPKPDKPIRHTRTLPPQPTSIVSSSALNEAHRFFIVTDESSGQVEEEKGPEPEEDGEETIEELDIQGVKLEEPDGPKPDTKPSPVLGVGWEPRVASPIIPAKFVRQERKTVSLALLAPGARTNIETELQQPLDMPSATTGVTSPTQITGIEDVSDFLRRRREARGAHQTVTAQLIAATQPEDYGAKDVPKRFFSGIPPGKQADDLALPSKRYLRSRLGASASLPMLHDT